MNILKESNYNVIEFLGGYKKRYMNLKYRFINGLIKQRRTTKMLEQITR